MISISFGTRMQTKTKKLNTFGFKEYAITHLLIICCKKYSFLKIITSTIKYIFKAKSYTTGNDKINNHM
jgi:hypothetical protein